MVSAFMSSSGLLRGRPDCRLIVGCYFTAFVEVCSLPFGGRVQVRYFCLYKFPLPRNPCWALLEYIHLFCGSKQRMLLFVVKVSSPKFAFWFRFVVSLYRCRCLYTLSTDVLRTQAGLTVLFKSFVFLPLLDTKCYNPGMEKVFIYSKIVLAISMLLLFWFYSHKTHSCGFWVETFMSRFCAV
jgi:hypothetical protein